MRINSFPDSRRLGIIINTTANRIPSMRTALNVRHTGRISFAGAFRNTLLQRRSSGRSMIFIKNAIAPPIRNGDTSANMLFRKRRTASRFISAHAKAMSIISARTMYCTI